MSRADIFLEGFKLGKLGARIKFSDKEESPGLPPKTVRHEIITDTEEKYPEIKWRDTDEKYYRMKIETVPLEIKPDGNWYISLFYTSSDRFRRSDVSWNAITSLLTEKQIRTLFKQLRVIVRGRGIDGMINSIEHWFAPQAAFKSAFDIWLKEKHPL